MSGTTPSTRKTLSFTAAQRKKECQTTSSGLPTYSILATGMIKEPTTAEDGDRFFPTSPGAYCPGYDHESQKKLNDVRRKAVGYLTYWSPLDDGKYYAVKFELQVDRDRGETIRGDQWVQPTESIRIVGLWIKAVTQKVGILSKKATTRR